MNKNVILTLLFIVCSLRSLASLPAITGSFSACVGASSTLMDSASGGVWTSSNSNVATVDPVSGIVYGASAGTAIIYYTVTPSSVNVNFTVANPPAGIVGAGAICVGATLQLSDATPGGAWTGGSNASVTSLGLVTGLHGGSQTIYYTVTAGCSASTIVTINAASVGPDTLITGPASVCTGSTIILSNSTGGGIWSSTVSSVATVTPGAGNVTGAAAGTSIISYTVNSACGPASIWTTITVSGTTTPPVPISGPSSVHVGGGSIILTDGIGGGVWTCTNTSSATIDPVSGVMTGLVAGTAPVIYSVNGCGGLSTVTTNITVTTFDGISGHILFIGTPYNGPVKVWLITGTTTLASVADVMAINNGTGTSYYYEFLGVPSGTSGVPAGDYKVKASLDTFLTNTGYIPTYAPGVFYSYDPTVDVITHAAGNADVNHDITMLSGTPTSGPGFIGGSVSGGANKGTSGGVPVQDLPLCVMNSATNAILQFTRTDAAGNYSFSGLPYGSYTVFPDSINYATTPYTGITLNAASPSVNTAAFTQHTISMTITPDVTGVNISNNAASSASVFPNPSTGKLYIQWKENVIEKSVLTITDLTGREVYHQVVNMTVGQGILPLDISGLDDGVYMVRIKSASLDQNSKIVISH